MKKFFICSTNACVERMFDCQKISNYLTINGWYSIKTASKADLIIINTCSFNKEEDESSINYVKYYLKRKKKSAQLIIAGCTPKISPYAFKQIGEFPSAPPTELYKLDDILNPEVKFYNVGEPNNISSSEILYNPIFKKLIAGKALLNNFFRKFLGRKITLRECIDFIKIIVNYIILLKAYINPLLVGNRNEFFYLRVSKGCLSKCAYCAKRFSTGVLNSIPLEEVINKFKKGLIAGHKLFFLLSEDVGCYGMDNSTTVVRLLKEIFLAGKGSDYKLAISNFNAQWFIKYYEELESIILDNQDKIFYIQIPIQSGNNRVLRLMRRHYSIEDVERCLNSLKKEAQSLNITTDIIVGFPGETEDDFNMSKEFIRRIGFHYVDIFTYANRPNTLASMMKEQTPQEVIERRSRELLRIQKAGYKSSIILKKLIELTRSFV